MQNLPRTLGLFDAAAVIAGIVIGAGIFLTPGFIARTAPSESSILAVWVIGGLLSLVGALALAELGAMFPATGGQYVYLREAFGPSVAFVYGWTVLLVIWSGAIAVTATGFAAQLGLSEWARRGTAAALILVLTALNYRGVRLAATVQNVLTVCKIGGLLLILAAGIFSEAAPALERAGQPVSLAAFGTACLVCLYAYEGWNGVTFVAGEIREPQRNVPLAMLIGVSLCVALYSAANWAFLRGLGVNGLAASDRAGVLLAGRAFGEGGARTIEIVVMIAMAGSCAAILFAASRLVFAQARDGYFFEAFGRVHPAYQTPATAVLVQGGWATVLVLAGTLDTLMSYAIVAAWIFHGLAVAGLIVLRYRRPDAPRPYRVWGAPWMPGIFCVAAAALVLNSFVTQPEPSFAALGLIATGAPAYWWLRRRAA